MVTIKCQEQGLAVAKIASGLPLSDSDGVSSYEGLTSGLTSNGLIPPTKVVVGTQFF